MGIEGKAEVIVYKGIKFRRYPESRRREDRIYFVPGPTHRMAGVGRLHQEIWKDAHGPIPDGYEVHHKDHNPLNNALDNLDLLSRQDHWQHHADSLTPEEREQSRARMDHARKAASRWHKSAEGREWHRGLARLAAESRYLVTKQCESCGKEYQTDNCAQAMSRFCSNVCKTRAREASGVDDEQRTCAHCGSIFTINKYKPTRYCSRTCSSRSRVPHEQRACLACGAIFEVQPSRKQRYCSSACAYADLRAQQAAGLQPYRR